ncbi:YugE family protein [Paenibacillus sp. HWE-109]|uniref:DUF1871 family protein n=1 Tax=Paenibacillus sp. HWE-109 TaxID=1306526 RepID=UPI001EDFD337|nr:DUF1871 family protein [Paenibacillus sp. HWE-109]UKS29749.1 YugE family protein [Paenibacillus sp. HWE-109]
MKFRAVSEQTRMNYMMWSIKREILKENAYLLSLTYDPTPIMNRVSQIIDAWDPIGLLDEHSLDDEYEGEARTITIFISKHLQDLNSQTLSKEIQKVFRRSFLDEFQDEEACSEIAAAMILSLQESHSLG